MKRFRSLTDEQLARLLERFDLPADTAVLGIRYEHEQGQVLVFTSAGRLLVPADVLELSDPDGDPELPTLFERPTG